MKCAEVTSGAPPACERMGDIRFEPYLDRVAHARVPRRALRDLDDAGVVSALAAASRAGDPYLANVLATEALNRARLKDAVTRTMLDGVYALDLAGNVSFLNPSAAKMLGRTPDELLGQDGHAAIHATGPGGEPMPRESCAVLRVLETATPAIVEEAWFRRADGTTFLVSYKAAPILHEGEPAGVVVVFHDASQMEQRHVATKRALAGFRWLFEDLPGMCFAVDEDLRIRQANAFGARSLGYEPRELVGTPILELIEPADRTRIAGLFAALRPEGPTYCSWETAKLRRDGARLWVKESVRLTTDTDGKPIYITFCQDISAHKAAERRLADQEQRYRSLFEHNPDAVFAIDLDGHFVDANPATARVTGHDMSALMGHAFAPFVHPEDIERVMTHFERAARGEAQHYDARLVGADGLVRHLRVANMPMVAGGRVVGVYGIAEDVTEARLRAEEIRQLNARLTALNEELEQRVAARTRDLQLANQELESFAYTVSHDLRAPLRGITEYARALDEDLADRLSPQETAMVVSIRTQAARLSDMVSGLLEMARLGKADISRENVDVTLVAEQVIAWLREQDPQRAVETVVQPGLRADADPRLVRVLMENLLRNAWKFTGGTLQPRIEVGGRSIDGARAFYVRDNGVGFDMAYAGRLFRPFQRLHEAGRFEGTGVGLATVRRIAERHGGRVWAESAPGMGATFWFTLADERAPRLPRTEAP